METENCNWCGKKLTKETISKSGAHPETNRICGRCDSLRDTMLDRIRYGSRLARYVAGAEAREAPAREKRIAEEAAKHVQEKIPSPADPPPRAAMTPDDIAKVVAAVMNELLK